MILPVRSPKVVQRPFGGGGWLVLLEWLLGIAHRPFMETSGSYSLYADVWDCVVSVYGDFSGVALCRWTLGFVQRPFAEALIC